VVLGKQRGDAGEEQVQQLVQYAAAAVTHPGGRTLVIVRSVLGSAALVFLCNAVAV
jgi:hypothetical protein